MVEPRASSNHNPLESSCLLLVFVILPLNNRLPSSNYSPCADRTIISGYLPYQLVSWISSINPNKPSQQPSIICSQASLRRNRGTHTTEVSAGGWHFLLRFGVFPLPRRGGKSVRAAFVGVCGSDRPWDLLGRTWGRERQNTKGRIL